MKVAFYTLGCKVNQYETDLMKDQFEQAGYEIEEFENKADIYVVNSCSVTNLSTRKTRNFLSRAKKQGGIVVLAGCYAQEIKDKQQIENVDVILGNEEKKEVVQYVQKYIVQRNQLFQIGEIAEVKRYSQKRLLQKARTIRESVKIEDGCNNFCSYCIIPYVRGRVRSRAIEEIIQEVELLVKSGVGEVVLVGIEIASYGMDRKEMAINLVDVIEQVAKVPGLKRIRLGSIEPRFLTNENIERMAKIEKLCPHFHLSVQSLENDVLKKMNRKYSVAFLLERIEKLKQSIPNVALTCDIIVGFPQETDQQFCHTLNIAKQIGFYEIHAFKYSKRKWTKAASMEGQVDGNVSQKRSEQLIALAGELKNSFMKQMIGKKFMVLFEEYKDGYLYGYTPNYIKVKVRGDQNLWGNQIEIELCSIEDEHILGKLI